MAVALAQLRLFTAEQYLEFEERSTEKSEYYYGHILAMAGGSLNHNTISMNIGGEFRTLLKSKKCLVVSSDQRVTSDIEDVYFYPDVTVVCGAPEIHNRWGAALLNPAIVVEVLSPSNSQWELVSKVNEYRRIESLRAILLVEQSSPTVHVIARQDISIEWQEWTVTGLDRVIELPQPACQLAMSEVYFGIEFNEE